MCYHRMMVQPAEQQHPTDESPDAENGSAVAGKGSGLPPGGQEKRKSLRIPLASVTLPFLGIREEDHLTFQYLLADASREGIQISIPEWVTAWNKLHIGDQIGLFLPMGGATSVLERGTIVWMRHDATHREQACGVSCEFPAFSREPFFLLESDGIVAFREASPDVSLKQVIFTLLKDSSLLKKNILIYFNHLMPYFSRIIRDRERYPDLREILFEDARRLVDEHYRVLKGLSERVAASSDVVSGLAELLDFEQLRHYMSSELDQALFQVVFEQETILWYLAEIKQLERRLFYNYNTLLICQALVLEEAQ